MNPDRFVTTLQDMIENSLADVHTMVPAKLTSVNYGSGKASALPLVKTQVGVNKVIPYPELSDIPLVIMSGNAGKARITFPVQAGDIVIVLFSERDPSNALASTGSDPTNPVQTNYLGLFPVGILPCISTSGTAKAISNEDVDLENDQAKINLKPVGDISLSNSTGSITLAESGTVTATDGTATFKLEGGALTIQGAKSFTYKGGEFNINGLKISEQGKLTDSGGISFNNHRHSGVERGDSLTDGPVI